MEGPTQFIEIPGYAEALRREDRLRRQAWTNPGDVIAGVQVRALTWRDIEILAELNNGFFCPWRFDTEAEYLAHCAQLVWWLSDCSKDHETWLGRVILEAQKTRLIRHLAQHPKELSEGVTRFLADTFADGPRGGKGTARQQSAAGGPAYVADLLAAAGYSLSIEEILDLPLVQLFQLIRLARFRLYGEKPVNDSDVLASDYLAKINQGEKH